MSIDRKKVVIFLAMTFGLCWTLALVFYLAGGRWQGPAATARGLNRRSGPHL
jgi:hypothetical protein